MPSDQTPTMPVPAAPALEMAACRESHARLHATVDTVTEEQLRAASRLSDWSIAHVLAHLARNADSIVRRLDAAAAGRLVDQYPGGIDGRHREIESGAGQSLSELVADLRGADDAVETAFDRFPPELWGTPVRNSGGREMPAAELATSRWREVEVHHVDLGLGYRPEDWPAALADRCLPGLLAEAGRRTDGRLLMAWLMDRGEPPTLEPWG